MQHKMQPPNAICNALPEGTSQNAILRAILHCIAPLYQVSSSASNRHQGWQPSTTISSSLVPLVVGWLTSTLHFALSTDMRVKLIFL